MIRHPRLTYTLSRALIIPAAHAPEVGPVADAIGTLATRHEALRTVVRMVEGRPWQVLLSSGSVPLTVLESTRQEVETLGERYRHDTRSESFDRESDVPFRARLFVVDGRVGGVVLIFDHLAVDRAGAEIVLGELRTLLAGGSLPPQTLQPLDLAGQEAAGLHTKSSDAAIRHWVEYARRIPFPVVASPRPEPEYQIGAAKLSSPALATAAGLLAARHKTTPATVVMASCAALVALHTSRSAVAMTTMVGNRFRPGFSRLVSNVAKGSLFAMEIPRASTLHDLIPQARAAIARTYRHAYYDEEAMEIAKAAVAAENDCTVSTFCCANSTSRLPALADYQGEDPCARLSETVVEHVADPRQAACNFCLQITGDEPRDFRVWLNASADCLPPADIRRFLLVLEAWIVESLHRDISVADIEDRAPRQRTLADLREAK